MIFKYLKSEEKKKNLPAQWNNLLFLLIILVIEKKESDKVKVQTTRKAWTTLDGQEVNMWREDKKIYKKSWDNSSKLSHKVNKPY